MYKRHYCKRQERSVKLFWYPKKIFEASKTDIPEQYRAIIHRISDKDLRATYNILTENHKKNIKTLTIDDQMYREDARMMDNAPLILYYKGEMRVGKSKTITVVGTRNATEYGKVAARLICLECLEKNAIIMSGLAIGIDRIAHETAIESGRTTYAFVAGGPDICYPGENSELMSAIEEQGAVISPYPVGTPPRKHQFIRRNKIMSIGNRYEVLLSIT